MKKTGILLLAAILTLGCNAQEKNKEPLSKTETDSKRTEPPKGTWKVDKEFDENGNMIRYDSIYSWSSGDDFAQLGKADQDSLLRSFQSRFYRNFSRIDDPRYKDLFADDSLFTKRFFDNDFFGSQFGKDFMDIDRVRERMEAMQKEFLERYQSQFVNPEEEGPDENN